MNLFLILVLSGVVIVTPICACNSPQEVPLVINNNNEETINSRGCITNTTFPNNKEVRSLEIDCSGTQLLITEVPKYFISHLNKLEQLLIKCSLERIQAGAFSRLPSLKDLDLSGNKLRSIEEAIFQPIPSLMYLNLSNNGIVFIQDKAFGNMPHLADLDLGHNSLDYLKEEWFTNTTTIEELYLNNNFLKKIPRLNQQNIYAFNFDYNQISFIHDGVFANDAEEINYLTMHHNQLTSINPKAFGSPIKQLDISSNLLVNLPLQLLEKINLKYIWIFGNPFECTCLRALETTLQAKRVAIMKPIIKKNCGEINDIPVRGVATGVITTNTPNTCNTTEDTELTNRLTKHLRKLGFSDLKDWYEQCSVLPPKTYLET